MTRLPRDVVEFAMRSTKKMLHGLSGDSVETIITQLRIARQHGTILQSDMWTAPDGARKVREELFHAPR